MEQRYIDRFHTKYEIDVITHCWNWTGSIDAMGYGVMSVGGRQGKMLKAHRISAAIHGLDMSGRVLRHMCHNKKCVNPDHLKTGSHQDNMNDSLAIGQHSAHKITVTPLGTFHSVKAAAQAHNIQPDTITRRTRNYPTEYYFINKN